MYILTCCMELNWRTNGIISSSAQSSSMDLPSVVAYSLDKISRRMKRIKVADISIHLQQEHPHHYTHFDLFCQTTVWSTNVLLFPRERYHVYVFQDVSQFSSGPAGVKELCDRDSAPWYLGYFYSALGSGPLLQGLYTPVWFSSPPLRLGLSDKMQKRTRQPIRQEARLNYLLNWVGLC